MLLPGIPGPETLLLDGDVLVIYGQEHDVKKVMQPLN
jgi:K+/H+ antiporter YhaU regulatory subunit KhtT